MEFSKLKAISSSFEKIKANPLIIFGISFIVVIFWAASFYVAFSIWSISESLGILSFFIVSIINLFVLMGYMKIAIKIHDGHSVSLMDLFFYYQKFSPFLISLLLYIAVIFLGMLFVVIPGIFLAVRFSFAPFFALEEDSSALELMKKSWKTTGGHFFDLLIFYLILVVLSVIGATVLYIGLAFTLPISLIAVVYGYRKLLAMKEKEEVEKVATIN